MKRFLAPAEIGTRGAVTLPRRFYTAPEVFRAEQERIFLSRWMCVGRESQIPRAGDFFTWTFADESIIVLRDRAGAARAFYNVCRHRGTRLCEAPRGKFAGSISCPYHAWTYALDGRLLGAPNMDDAEGFCKDDYPLHSVATAEWEGFLFVCLADAPQPFLEAFAPLLGKFARFNLQTLQVAKQIDYDVRANWKLIFQNYSECYHCPSIHPA